MFRYRRPYIGTWEDANVGRFSTSSHINSFLRVQFYSKMRLFYEIAAVAAFMVYGSNALLNSTVKWPAYIKYSTVTGYFLQDEPDTNSTIFDYTQHDFGLIKRNYPATRGLKKDLTQWQKFEKQVEALNNNAPEDTTYKLFWLGRHGEGYHNAAESL